MRIPLALCLTLALGACASPSTKSGFLTTYEGLQPRSAVRAEIMERQEAAALASVRSITMEPTTFASGVPIEWMTEGERELLLREVDAQLCFELSERYEMASDPGAADARVRAAITAVRPTGRVASAASAAADFFIPGPIGLRVPGSVGALAVEAEMLNAQAGQIAAISWNRAATPVGTDSPSFSRVGDALQFAEPFADAAAQTMTAPGAQSRPIPKPDPCAAYGPRFRPEGFLAKFATGLYVPQMSGARPEAEVSAEP